MALKITDNFEYTGRKPNFDRDQFTSIAAMADCNVCDEGHISYNTADGKHYVYKSTNDDSTYGKWSQLNTGTSYTHPNSHPASMITYNSSTEYESGNVGYEIKQLVTSLSAKSFILTPLKYTFLMFLPTALHNQMQRSFYFD